MTTPTTHDEIIAGLFERMREAERANPDTPIGELSDAIFATFTDAEIEALAIEHYAAQVRLIRAERDIAESGIGAVARASTPPTTR